MTSGRDWAAGVTGSPVVDARGLTGGTTSTLLALTHADGQQTVLREIDREPWLTHRVELATREHETQRALAATDVPAPRTLALDAAAGRHLMTLLPGAVQQRDDHGALEALARTLASVHAVRPATPARPYQSWAWEAKHVVPARATDPGVWARAFELLQDDLPAHDETFLHRDFHAANVLWHDGEVSGVVDWVETSTGPAWLDVAHCGTNLAVRHGLGAAARFASTYAGLTGRPREPYWEVMDVVGFLPPPGGPAWLTDPEQLARLEARLVDSLTQL